MATTILLSRACEGMIRFKVAVGMSSHTISDYRTSFKKALLFFKNDPPLGSITRDQLVGFFAWLQDGYVAEPDGVAPRGRIKLSPKSVLNVHTNLSALWSWAVKEGLAMTNIVRGIDPPRVSPPVVEALTKDEIAALLKACDSSRSWKNRPGISNHRPTASRDRAIIMTLLDTGIRASELCTICYSDVNLATS